MYRPPVGLPRREQKRWHGWLASVLAHLLLLALIIYPARDAGPDLGHHDGAGGAGPAGGGGGGLGDAAPRVRFVTIAPPAAAATAQPVPVAPKVVAPTPVPPPQPVTPPKPAVAAPTVVAPPVTTPMAGQSAPTTTGAGGTGVGTTGGAGAGPGSGGGVGSGQGPGRGSATGPGTGGGNAKNYPPTPRQFFLPPLPAPASLHGFTLVAWFDVDSTGKSTLIRFTPSPDGKYNEKLRETLLQLRFRPAVRPDGTPVRDTVDVRFSF